MVTAPQKRSPFVGIATCALLLILAIIGIGLIAPSRAGKPSSDADLVKFAGGLNEQLGWTSTPQDATAQIAKDAPEVGKVLLAGEAGTITLVRYPAVSDRKAAEGALSVRVG